jgi:2-oxoisovalerate dehydrogenase E1 component
MLVDAQKIVDGARSVIAGISPMADHWHHPGGVAAAQRPNGPSPASEKAPSSAPPLAPLPDEGEAIIMPFGDLTVSEGTIVNWLKTEGDAVTAGEVIAEIETDKAVIEIEAPIAGTLGPIERKKGEVVPMGGRIGSVRP